MGGHRTSAASLGFNGSLLSPPAPVNLAHMPGSASHCWVMSSSANTVPKGAGQHIKIPASVLRPCFWVRGAELSPFLSAASLPGGAQNQAWSRLLRKEKFGSSPSWEARGEIQDRCFSYLASLTLAMQLASRCLPAVPFMCCQPNLAQESRLLPPRGGHSCWQH